LTYEFDSKTRHCKTKNAMPMQYFFVHSNNYIATALLNINDDKQDADDLTTNTNCTHKIGSLIAEFASQGPNYSSATDVLA